MCTGKEAEEEAETEPQGTETVQEEPIYSSQPANEIQPFAMDNANNAGDFNVTGGTDWAYDESKKELTFTASGEYTVTGDGAVTTERIIVSGNNIEVTITLDNVNIDVSGNQERQAFLAKDYGQTYVNVTIILQGTNKLTSSNYWGGITWNNTDGSSTLTINGNGSLIVAGGDSGAGIGASWNNQGTKNITIMGGTITAVGGNEGAGIGGGNNGSASDITITGGSVKANILHWKWNRPIELKM